MKPMRHRPNQLICNINVAAFASVMLALLYLFMPWRADEYRRPAVDFAKVSSPVPMRAADREDAMVVAITRDNRVFFGAEAVRPADLPAKIQEEISRGSEREVYIKADARARYGWVAEVLDNVRSAGIEKIGFLVDQRRPAAPNPQ
jgi:biopolymer transport protein ExbD/biopolymer transport protein TolR